MPTVKPISATTHTFLERVMAAPTCWPMGIMAMSAPSVNSPIPNISSAAPTTNPIMELLDTGTSVRQSANTSAVMGMTEVSASRHFSRSMLRFLLGISSIPSSIIQRP